MLLGGGAQNVRDSKTRVILKLSFDRIAIMDINIHNRLNLKDGACRMFCLYSKGCEYAIRALSEIAHGKIGDKFLARDICLKVGIPEAYARKTFQALVQNGFLKAVTGPGGGYSLTRDPIKTSVLDVIEAVEGKEHFSKCILGLPACNNQSPCALHAIWMEMKAGMITALGERKIIELAADPLAPKKNKKKKKG